MQLLRQIVAAIALLLFALSAQAQNKQKIPPEAQKAMDAVRKHIDSLEGGKNVGTLNWKSDDAVKTAFPGYFIIDARFPQFPVARVVPAGLRPSSLFAVDKDNKLEFINKDSAALEKFFRRHSKVKTQADAKNVLAAWLTLTQESHQDGFFTFEVLTKEFSVEGKDPMKASGRLVVMKGGNGELKANLEFDQDGKLAKVTEQAAIRPGPRPICQATKLLDADPIVRKMAEADLLFMGVAARAYLTEQRQIATPELRQAIDRLWQQIQKNGW